ncbi:MAG: STAS domain-containing protein [Planctomycetes bacterium]|nr:STAS domain-containing protein [Planctomycetota bacterium]
MTSLADFKPAFMTLEIRGPIVVAHITRQNLSEEENIEELGQEFSMLVEHFSCRLLAVDMQAVSLITSAALGKLISLHRNLHRRDGRLVVCGVSGMVEDVLRTARLTDYFSMATTTDEAVALLENAAG